MPRLTCVVSCRALYVVSCRVAKKAMARMSVGEMLTNIVWAKLSGLGDIKCSGNWMWAAKLPHEGAALYDACKAMSEMMIQLGIAIDGGKDSLR
jgi:phosphoribosylformylglycinamidine synthase